MTRPRHRRTTSRLLTRVVLAGLCVGTGALAVGTVLPRLDLAATPKTPTPTGSMTTIPTSVTGTSNPGSTTATTVPATTVPATTVPPTTVPVSGGGRPAGLMQLSGSKTNCPVDGPARTGFARRWNRPRVSPTTCIETFTDTEKTWAEWVNPWIAASAETTFQTWMAADPTGHQLIDTQNLIPEQRGLESQLDGECRGRDDNSYAGPFRDGDGLGGLWLLGDPPRP